jgi:uncharacterized protein YbbC (DUF1343 family)
MPEILFGLDRFIKEAKWRKPLAGLRVALVAHPASVTADLTHALDAIHALPDIRLSAAFGPQHGLRGDKQDNMVESDDFFDPVHAIPVFSLYGKTRRPTPEMMDSFDALIVDLQDLGCRVYTFITTLRYLLEAAAAHAKPVWLLDRPNPVGRPVEGTLLEKGWESFVGADRLPMRHGLTLGELALFFVARLKLDVELTVVPMRHWRPEVAPGHGWPLLDRAWVNPSPNAPTLSMARCYPGTVMLEGTTLSEGRGTTRPLEGFGAPDIDARKLLDVMTKLAPEWTKGCRLRETFFEPVFHKHAGTLCRGLQIHVEAPHYRPADFRPWRLMGLVFKALRRLYPDYPLWRDFPYEYEKERLAIDLVNGGTLLREWVDDDEAAPEDLDRAARADEARWRETREEFLIYGFPSSENRNP